MNYVEKNAFMSINESVGWLGTKLSLFCSFHFTHLQQNFGECQVSALISPFTSLRILKNDILSTFSPLHQSTGSIFPLWLLQTLAIRQNQVSYKTSSVLLLVRFRKEVPFMLCYAPLIAHAFLPSLLLLLKFSLLQKLLERRLF